mgnify:CR=1 FL=1
MIIQQELFFDSVNVSAQVGDIVYFTSPPNGGQLVGGFDYGEVGVTSILGPIMSISGGTITVQYDNSIVTTSLSQGDFISFVKDKSVNTSSLLGYYASVNFVNNSTGKIELFSVGSDISESSK